MKLPYKIVSRHAEDIEQIWADAQKANRILNWQAKETIENTLLSAWNWEKRLREIQVEKVFYFSITKSRLTLFSY